MRCILAAVNFNPRSPRGGATGDKVTVIGVRRYFNPRSPRGGATCPTLRRLLAAAHFNPRSPRGGATINFIYAKHVMLISIHAPHEGERPYGLWATPRGTGFQSTLPTRGSDGLLLFILHLFALFQSTLPTRGSDYLAVWVMALRLPFQSTLPTRGSDDNTPAGQGRGRIDFNPRSPRGGATPSISPFMSRSQYFNPRSPRGGATVKRPCVRVTCIISIHAPHEGERQRKSAFVCSISANLLNIIHCGAVTRAVSRRRIALFRLFSVRRSGVFMYAYASH